MSQVIDIRRGKAFAPNLMLLKMIGQAIRVAEGQKATYQGVEKNYAMYMHHLIMASAMVEHHIASAGPLRESWLYIRAAALMDPELAEKNTPLRALQASPGFFRIE